MQLLLSRGDHWESVEVSLQRGSVPCIGGTTLDQQQLETALWFKVLVLDVVCVDCSERIISWTVKSSDVDVEGGAGEEVARQLTLGSRQDGAPAASFHHQHHEATVPTTHNLGSATLWSSESDEQRFRSMSLSLSSLNSQRRTHSFMAAHDSDSTLTCTDDLQMLFELASSLLATTTSMRMTSSMEKVKEVKGRSELWLQLVHCYLLPVITVYQEDLPAVELVKEQHQQVLRTLDQDIEALSCKIAQVKECLNGVLVKVQSSVESWVHYDVSSTFILLIVADLKLREQEARVKIQSCTRNLEYSLKLEASLSLSASTKRPNLSPSTSAKKSSLSPSASTENPSLSPSTSIKSPNLSLSASDESPNLSPSTSAKNLRLSPSTSTTNLQSEKLQAEQVLFEMLQLRSQLVEAVSYSSNSQTIYNKESSELQMQYIKLHSELDHMRRQMAALTSNKVLALSVREAIEQALVSLQTGCATSGMDIGRHGGSSTDVLAQQTSSLHSRTLHQSDSNTWRDNIQKLLQVQSSRLATLHNSFCVSLRSLMLQSSLGNQDGWEYIEEPVTRDEIDGLTGPGLTGPGTALGLTGTGLGVTGTSGSTGNGLSPANFKAVSVSIKQHFKKVAEEVGDHFNNRSSEFSQRIWLCYEKLFFEQFSESIFKLCLMDQAKYCNELMLNAISVSMVNPHHLDLGVADEVWLSLFPPRSYSSARLLYEEVQGKCWSVSSLLSSLQQTSTSEELPCMELFGGVATDLASLVLALSPLDKLQLMTSAFRKATTALAVLKQRAALDKTSGTVQSPVAAVSCDDILPVLVLLMLQWSPWLLALVHINCCILTDFIAPFLASGWHGYSLAAFTSTVVIIKKL